MAWDTAHLNDSRNTTSSSDAVVRQTITAMASWPCDQGCTKIGVRRLCPINIIMMKSAGCMNAKLGILLGAVCLTSLVAVVFLACQMTFE